MLALILLQNEQFHKIWQVANYVKITKGKIYSNWLLVYIQEV